MTKAKQLLVFCLVAAAGSASPALAVISTSVTTGVRGADFDIAPTSRSMTLSEVEARVGSSALVTVPGGIGISGGVSLAYQSMQGSLGNGLESFSGVSFGPELRAELPITSKVRTFATVGYRLGRYTGQGSENWSDARIPAQYFYLGQSNESHAKRFASAGTHLSVGCAATVWQAVSALAAVDLGVERMNTDTRVIDGTLERADRNSGAFDSRALMVGARVDL